MCVYCFVPAHVNYERPQQRTASSNRLRIGLMSSYFHLASPIGLLLESVLAAHDRAVVEISCYAMKRPTDLEIEFERPFHRICER